MTSMSSNNFPRVFLNNKEEKEIQQGFPWVFDNEISHIKHRADGADDKSEWKNEVLGECSVEDGSTVEVYTKAGGFLGTGIFNKKSKITVRLIGNEHADVIMADTAAFYEKKILDAYNMRRMFYKDSDSYRLIFGEADFIPGLICERFCDENGRIIIVVQFLSLSCEVFKEDIISALKKVCKPDCIYERSDASVRDKEGLEQTAGWIFGNGETTFNIIENGIKLGVDIANGQKTGYFLDQKFNRIAAAAIPFLKGRFFPEKLIKKNDCGKRKQHKERPCADRIARPKHQKRSDIIEDPVFERCLRPDGRKQKDARSAQHRRAHGIVSGQDHLCHAQPEQQHEQDHKKDLVKQLLYA